MNVIKRNGKEVLYDDNKIFNAISKASIETSKDNPDLQISESDIHDMVSEITSKYLKLNRSISIEEIQDDVEEKLMERAHYDVAKAYIRYRYERELVRRSNTTDESILTLINGDNEVIKQENSNKNPTIISVQRDYMAGEVSKDISNRFLLSKDVVDAHKKGLIHFHDADYFAQRGMYNCFMRTTKFITNKGVIAFSDCKDGQKIKVLDKDGIWRKAIVHKYHKQIMYDIVLKCCRTEKTITCTRDHRWVLDTGKVTTNLQVGDRLYHLHDSRNNWTIKSIRDKELFALGFVLGDGNDEKNMLRVRLCGDKNSYVNIFEDAGYTISRLPNSNDHLCRKSTNISKSEFLNNKDWKYLSRRDKAMLFKGYYAADGAKHKNSISTTNKSLLNMIKDISAIAGYHICSIKEYNRNTNFKDNSLLYTVNFICEQKQNRPWIVKSIKKHVNNNNTFESWCVEEPITHTFTLDGGIVTGNCCLVNLKDMLQNGTVISGTMIEKPHRFSTACTIATQIIAQVASNQYGGQSISLAHLAPFVNESRIKIFNELVSDNEKYSLNMSNETIKSICEEKLRSEIKQGIQTIQYQVVTLMTTNGQAPFLTVFMYLNEANTEQEKYDLAILIEEMLNQRYQGVKNEKGAWITPAFPKLIYVLEEDNIHENSKYYYLTKLAAKCTAKRLVPDYISEKIMLKNKVDKNGNGHCYPCMGCRSFLTPYVDPETNESKYYGRFNQGVVTVNLVDIGLSAHKDMDLFWKIFDERLELCHKALQFRHERLTGALSDVAPILWQYGALARLNKGEKIDKYLHGGYSTLSLGYAGLWECVYSLIGKKLTEPEGEELGLKIMVKMNEYTNKWKAAENIDYSIYGTPLESTTYKFAKTLQERFGVIEGVTDKNYITNSYHIHVTEHIDAFEKLRIESKFQALSPGGAISYVEVPNLENNIDAVLELQKFMYDNIMYSEINTKSDYCQVCGYTGEIQIIEDENKKLIWECPNCGNKDQTKMNVARRTCGYIGSQFWNQGLNKCVLPLLSFPLIRGVGILC